MLKREEYKQLADRINTLMEWRVFTWEMITFFTFSLLAPPVAAYMMVSNSSVRHTSP
jgi:hypothetical protein